MSIAAPGTPVSQPGPEPSTIAARSWASPAFQPSGSHAFLWEDGSVLDLGTLPGTVESEAQAINEFGTVVGYARPSVGADTAMLWRDGELHDLNDLVAADDPLKSRVRLTGAGDINNFGWIAAGGFDSTYEPWQQRGYVLIPVW
jgi:probable HAF family extracellular repeat protein